MAFDNVVRLISGGTSYYLSGSAKNSYTGSGTPWTAENTTPYRLSLNDVTPIWVPQPSATLPVYGGGPPFRSGRTLVSRSYDNVTESIGVQMYANSADNASALLRQLRQILNTTSFSLPCVLAIQTGTNTAYYEIYHADVQETTDYLKEGGSTDNLLRATITWTRSFAGGLLSTGETVLNNVSFENEGTGSPDNIAPYSTGAGDMIYEGQPLNIRITPTTASQIYQTFFLASISSRSYGTTGAGALTTSTSGSVVLANFDMSACLTNAALKPRFLVRASYTANAQSRLRVRGATSAQYVYTSKWINPGHTNTTIVDHGYFIPSLIRRSRGVTTQTFALDLDYRSTNGASATVTLASTEYLLYYDFCTVTSANVSTFVSAVLQTDTFAEQTNAPCLPFGVGRALTLSSGLTIIQNSAVTGTLPRYWSGASLYMMALRNDLSHNTGDAFTVNATHAPLWRTLRGSN